MSISKLFEGGFIQRNKGHFAAIVRVGMDDGFINEAEQAFLDRLAIRLGIDKEQYKTILKDYKNYPINPPTSYERRLERLYDLARMVKVDDNERPTQIVILKKLCVGLGFNPDNVKYIADKALDLVNVDSDSETFIENMRHMHE